MSFWKRQFSPHPTAEQIGFDLAFGVMLPIICFMIVPIVFESFHLPATGRPPIVIIVAIGMSMLALVVWFVQESQLAFLAGVMTASGAFSFLIGISLAPLSVLGMFYLVGFLGFLPFITAFVFFRNAHRASLIAFPSRKSTQASILFFAGILSYASLPPMVHIYINHKFAQATEQLLSDDCHRSAEGEMILKRFGWIADLSILIRAYSRDSDSSHRERLANIYQELAGEEINSYFSRMDD